MPEPFLPGFHYDLARARFIAEAVRPALQQAKDAGSSVPDQLAGLTLALAAVIAQSGLKADPLKASEAVAAFLLQVLAPSAG